MRDLGRCRPIFRTHKICDIVQQTPGYLVDRSVYATCAVLLTEMTTIANRTSRFSYRVHPGLRPVLANVISSCRIRMAPIWHRSKQFGKAILKHDR
jgi:hypothetical protein